MSRIGNAPIVVPQGVEVSVAGAEVTVKGPKGQLQVPFVVEHLAVDKQGNDYYLHENESLSDIFENNIEKFIVPQIMERVKEYLEELDNDK